MHPGCFVWTPTPHLSDRRTARPGPARVCLCVVLFARSGRLAFRARFGAPHLSFSRFILPLCSSPSGLGLPVLRFFLFVCHFPSLPSSLLAPPPSPALHSSRPSCPGPWHSSFAPTTPQPPPPFFFLLLVLFRCPTFLASLRPAAPLSLTVAFACLRPWVSPPPLFSPFFPPLPCAPVPVFFVFFLHLLRGPLFRCFRCPGPWHFVRAPLPTPPLFFFAFFFLSAPPLSRRFRRIRPWVPWASEPCLCRLLPPLAPLSLPGFLFPPPFAPLRVVCVLCAGAVPPPRGGCSCFAVSRVLCGAAVCCGLFCVVGGFLRCFPVPCGVGVVLCCVLMCCVIGVSAGSLASALLPPFFVWVVRYLVVPCWLVCCAFTGCRVVCFTVSCPGARRHLVVGSAALCRVLLPSPHRRAPAPLLPLPGPLGGPLLCSVLECGAVLVCCAACRPVCCGLRRLVLVLPCCFVCAGWYCVLLPVVARCSLLGLVARCCLPLACSGKSAGLSSYKSYSVPSPRPLLPGHP